MFKIVEGNTFGLSDVTGFVDRLNRLPEPLSDYFERSRDVIVTRAPGRLDVMGGIADYSGSLVLEMPIAEATFAAIQTTANDQIEIVSLDVDGTPYAKFQMRVGDLESDGRTLDAMAARRFLEERKASPWVNYVAGVFFTLGHELGVRFPSGVRLLIASRVPIGKGVSSSAALEVSVMQAVCSAFSIKIEPRDLAVLCQKVENEIVGAACGVMDQITSHCGTTGKLLALLCQPAEIKGAIDIPNEIEFWGIDSGVRHSVAGSNYTSVRVGAFMGYRIIAELAGLRKQVNDEFVVRIDDNRWNGYLANVSPGEYENEFGSSIPEEISGSEFISRYGGTTDPVTTIDPERTYAGRKPTEHAIYESFRVAQFAKLLQVPINDDYLTEAGELMFASHESYRSCGLTEPRTDRIVELVRQNRANGLFGARITGGGSGGTVAVLARRESRKSIDELTDRFSEETGEKPYVFHGSSPGCSLFGHLRLRKQF